MNNSDYFKILNIELLRLCGFKCWPPKRNRNGVRPTYQNSCIKTDGVQEYNRKFKNKKRVSGFVYLAPSPHPINLLHH